MKEQVTINSAEFAQKSHEIHGTIAPRDLNRLENFLASSEGWLQYRLGGEVDAQGRSVLVLHLQGELPLVCQRCLGPVAHAVDATARFVIVASEDHMPLPDDEPDDVDYLVADPRMDVMALVEDEVLLGLPMAPLHESAVCGPKAADAKEQKESPFKVLQGLKFDKR